MSDWKHDNKSKTSDMIKDISDKHCPDSVRQSAYSELERRGYSKDESRAIADHKHGDFHG